MVKTAFEPSVYVYEIKNVQTRILSYKYAYAQNSFSSKFNPCGILKHVKILKVEHLFCDYQN